MNLQGGKMAELQNVTEESWQSEVIDAERPVLVDFSAVWCGPCKMLDPVVKQLAEDWQDKVKVVKIDADQNPNILTQYGVMGIPTLMLFNGGEMRERLTGYMPKDKLLEKLSPHL
jgi:thioredoxin 1